MRPEEIKMEIDNLVLAEKLILVEDVWDSIAESNPELPLPEWQRQELDQRYQDYKDGTLGLHDWNSVHEELRNKYITQQVGAWRDKFGGNIYEYGIYGGDQER